jgi:(2Fe-2S) ferredoxin
MATQTMQTAAPRAVILLRVGDRNVKARQRFRETAKRLEARLAGPPVVAAYVVPGVVPNEVTLTGAVEHLVNGGATEIAVVPYEVEWKSGESQDVPDTIQELARAHPNVTIHLAQPLGVSADVVQALANRYEAAWSLPDMACADVHDVVEIAAQPPIAAAALRAGEAPGLPAHAKHVFVCVGRVCQQDGSEELYDTLVDLLDARGLAPEPAIHGLLGRQRKAAGPEPAAAGTAAPTAVKVTRSKCLAPCAGSPVACVYPEGTFYWNLSTELLPQFVDEVLVGGGTLPGHTFRPGE